MALSACPRWTTTTQDEFQNPYARKTRDYHTIEPPQCPRALNFRDKNGPDKKYNYCPPAIDLVCEPCDGSIPVREGQPNPEGKPFWCIKAGENCGYIEDDGVECSCGPTNEAPIPTSTSPCTSPAPPKEKEFICDQGRVREANECLPRVLDPSKLQKYCEQKRVNRYMYTTSYREMNKDGAALCIDAPVTREDLEKIKLNAASTPEEDPLKDRYTANLSTIGAAWDRVQVRPFAQKCDTLYANPCLDRTCEDKDLYFQEQYLCRDKFATPPNVDEVSEENMRLARLNLLRLPYTPKVVNTTSYHPTCCAPPVCKIKNDKYKSPYKLDFIRYPNHYYENPTKPIRPDRIEGVCMNPIVALHCKMPPIVAYRLSNYNQTYDCEKEWDRVRNSRNKGEETATSDPGPYTTVELPNKEGKYPFATVSVPPECMKPMPCKRKENLAVIGTMVNTGDSFVPRQNLGTKKKPEVRDCVEDN